MSSAGEGQAAQQSGAAAGDARERVLHVAERLFMERGYAAVTLRDIAKELGIRQPSLYYHAPGGKEELFVAVMERCLARHHGGLSEILEDDSLGLEASLKRAARWFITQPPVNLLRVVRSDMPAIDAGEARRLSMQVYVSLLKPLRGIFERCVKRGEIEACDAELMAGSFVAVMDAICHASQAYGAPRSVEAMADEMIGVLARGLVRGP